MSIIDLYSQSQQAPVVNFQYNAFPKDLKIQFIHTWNGFFSQEQIPIHIGGQLISQVTNILLKEHALSSMPNPLYNTSPLDKINIYFERQQDVFKSLDIVQVFCFYMEHLEGHLKDQGYHYPLSIDGSAAVSEINERFVRSGIGYQYSHGKIIRMDNLVLHKEVVERTIQLLQHPMYANVSKEFLTAHDHFRCGRNADCISWSLKAFESIMKVIADKNNWKYDSTATAKPLIQLLFHHSFFPPYLANAVAGLRNFLENSLPTIRNKKGGHGSGSVVNHVPDSLAQYMLYITGATINLIAEIHRERTGH